MPDAATQQTTIIGTYGTRRDAEIARDHLEGAGISAAIRADDAGGMHPELQWSQGVRLVVLGDAAGRAREALREAGLVPPVPDEPGAGTGDPVGEVTLGSAIRALLWVLALLVAGTAVGLLLRLG